VEARDELAERDPAFDDFDFGRDGFRESFEDLMADLEDDLMAALRAEALLGRCFEFP
jgi:hypothetical protein